MLKQAYELSYFLNSAVKPTDPYQILTEERVIIKKYILIWFFIENINPDCPTSMGIMNTRECMLICEFKKKPHLWWNKHAGVHIWLQISIIFKSRK